MSNEQTAAPLALAYPRNGYVNHIIKDRPTHRHPHHRHISYARALCGISGRDAWGGGFMLIREGQIEDSGCRRCLTLAQNLTQEPDDA